MTSSSQEQLKASLLKAVTDDFLKSIEGIANNKHNLAEINRLSDIALQIYSFSISDAANTSSSSAINHLIECISATNHTVNTFKPALEADQHLPAKIRHLLIRDLKSNTDSLHRALSNLTHPPDSPADTTTNSESPQKQDIRDARRLIREARSELEELRTLKLNTQAEFQIFLQQNEFALKALGNEVQSKTHETVALLSQSTVDELRKLRSETLDAITVRFDAATASHSETVKNLHKEIELAITSTIAANDTYLEKIQNDFGQISTELRTEASKTLEQLKGHDQDARKLLGIIGTNGTAQGFHQEAESARQSMKSWNWTAVASIVSMTIWAALLVIAPSLRDDSPWGIVGRLAVFTSLFILAGYAAAQATHARKVELQLRRTALELAALPPFMAPLPDEKSHELRSLMAQRTFGRESFFDKPGEPSAALLDTIINKDLAPLLLQVAIEALKRQEKK